MSDDQFDTLLDALFLLIGLAVIAFFFTALYSIAP